METLRAFLGGGGGGGIVGATGATSVASAAGAAEASGGGNSGGEGGARRGGKFLLSSKRYRSSRVRSASYIWSKNGVWKVQRYVFNIVCCKIRYMEGGGSFKS